MNNIDSFILDVLGALPLPRRTERDNDRLAVIINGWQSDMVTHIADYDAAVSKAMNDPTHTDDERQQLSELWMAFRGLFDHTSTIEAWAASKDRCTSFWWMHVLIRPYRNRDDRSTGEHHV